MSESHSHHITPISTYAKVLVILMILMLLTIGAAELHISDNSYVNNGIAMTIAIVKATLVVAYFMGVKYGTKLIKMWAYAGFTWFLLMFVMYCDYVTRGWEPVPGWEKEAPNALPRGVYKPPAADAEVMKTE